MAVKASKTAALPRGTKMTIALPGNPFPIEIGVKAAVLVKSGTGRLSAKTVCREHLLPVERTTHCPDEGGECDGEDTVYAYDVDGRFVEVDTTQLGAEKDDRLELKALVDPGTVDPLYFERPYAVFADEKQEASFALLAAALRESGKWAVGTAVLNKSAKAVVMRWSAQANCLLMHACTFDARVEWGAVAQVTAAQADAPQLEGAQAKEAATLIANMLDDSFGFDTVVDQYAVDLKTAVDAAAQGLAPIVREQVVDVTPVADLMAALRATVATKAKKPARAKVAA